MRIFILVLVITTLLLRTLTSTNKHPKNQSNISIIINHHNTKHTDYTSILSTIKEISFKQWKHKICRYKQKHLILILLLSGDIELNPGPVSSKCQICIKACTTKQGTIQCDTCNEWYHIACLHSNTPKHIAIGLRNKYASWHCIHCGLPQISSDLFNYKDLITTNSYSVLANPFINKPLDKMKPTTQTHKITHKKSNNNNNQNILKTLIVNFQSLKNKIPDLELLIKTEEPDIIAGSETWLNPNIYNSEILNTNYNIFRKDRPDNYGGVLLAIKSNIIAEEITTQPNFNIESIYCKIITPNSSPLIVGSIYRPPNTNLEYMNNLCSQLTFIKENNKNAVLWIMGDFNLPDINWKNYTIDNHQTNKEINEHFLDTINNINLEQIVKTATRKNKTLDLFLTNRPGLVLDYKIIPGLSDHDIVRVTNTIKTKINKIPRRIIYLWNKCNSIKLHQSAANFQQTFLSKFNTNSPVEEIWKDIKTNLKTIMDENVPTKLTSNKINKCWFNSRLKKLCKLKENLFKKYKATNSYRIHKKYLKIKHLTQKLSRNLQNEYINNVITKDNNKNLWSFIKSKKMEPSGIATLKGSNNKTYNDNETKANILNTYFASSFSASGDKEVLINLNKMEEIGNITVDEIGIHSLLKNLKINKATGPDDLPARLLKELSNELSPILVVLFQASLNQGKVPQDWKLANVSPLFKKGDKSDPGNYRPVSLTSITCKLLEHIIYSRIVNHLDKYNALCPHQHGFRKNRSCETQLIGLIDELSKGLDKNDQIDTILLDFSKAFDKVHHLSLLKKLNYFGISGSLHHWIQDFLLGREQTVIINGSKSAPIKVNSGVPQGTVLGPLLFLIYINDLPNNISTGTKVRLFADDCIIYRTIKSEQDSKILQKDLDELIKWETNWSMSFHPEKCQLLRVTKKKKQINSKYFIHGKELTQTKDAKYLGVIINEKLSWNPHVNEVIKKSNKTLGFIKRNLYKCNKDIKLKCYLTLVRPVLEYASSVWDPSTKENIDKLEQIQKRAARFITGEYSKLTRITPLVKSLNLETLEDRRTKSKVVIIHKAINSNLEIQHKDNLIQPSDRHKDKNTFLIPYARTNTYKFSFFPSGIRAWNGLPEESRKTNTLSTFKSLIKMQD